MAAGGWANGFGLVRATNEGHEPGEQPGVPGTQPGLGGFLTQGVKVVVDLLG